MNSPFNVRGSETENEEKMEVEEKETENRHSAFCTLEIKLVHLFFQPALEVVDLLLKKQKKTVVDVYKSISSMGWIEYFDRTFKPSYCRKEPLGVFIIVKSLGS